MNLRSSLACTSSDIARWGLRSVLKRQGGVLPGRIAMKIDPELLSDLAGLVDRSVVITGTNGKTTTSNLIADAVAASGAAVVCNRAGNNMEPGVVGALLEARGGLKHTSSGKRVGVFECDELYTVRVLPKLKPTYFVLLNLFRDQLDRYGEIDHTQEVIAHALELSPATTLIYNADDPLCASIAARVPNASIAFGIDGATDTESDRISDSRFCSQCNAPLEYDYVQYGQLGAYHCPSCGWARPALVRRVTGVKLGCDGYGFDLVFGSAPDAAAVHIATRYNGLYMVYNVAAAFFAARELGVDTAFLQPTLDAYVPAGGRMGRWEIAGRTVEANLAKNPVGFDRQIQSIKTAGGRLCAFFLNDNDADGHDVSWIYDVDFERIADTPGLVAFAGGTRAHDMQVRLKYAGIDAAIISDVAQAIGAVADEAAGDTFYAVANYTAFPPLVKELDGLKGADAATVAARAATCADGSAVPVGIAPVELSRPLRIVYLYPDALNLYGDGGN
ncbi:MurT ligase domain-containing protein, partial [Collinsella aerofaciens]